ncbi:glycosyltransferase [Solwaraspora sp. WMMD1047]|uniref:glycosyltransferase n=1 Tax=Solwaraspora sp. WMMD1047 TaxID=3016102 RepID=UPI00241699FA|nr:glycosyltransferase [Solwaraspora sp. WMMD1047]MDG4832806.1 glycosyltransferase [Solwaraspora sp. WMMD1047]
MRIALISEHANPLAATGGSGAGGQHVHVAELSAALADDGHEVRVYTRHDAPGPPTTGPVGGPVGDGPVVVPVPVGPPHPTARGDLPAYLPEFGAWLGDRWRDGAWRPDVVHAHFWTSGVAALTASRRTGVPVVLTYHALGVALRDRGTGRQRRIGYERALGHGVHRVVAQCQQEVGDLIRMGVPRGRISVVPPGVDQRRFTPDGPRAARHAGRPRILTVGRLTEQQGMTDVIRAMRAVPEAECVVVGGPADATVADDPSARELRSLAEACGVAGRLRLVGAVSRDELPAWYRSADLVVAAARQEPFGLPPLEAMACGVPVVGTAVGGHPDTIVDGLTGDLVPPRDPVALGAAIRRLLRDPTTRFTYATAALDRVRSAYPWQRSAEQLVDIYATVGGLRAVA